MFTLKVGEKELHVKYGFRATLQTRLLSKMAKTEHQKTEGMEGMEDTMLLLPEYLLIGLQKFHSDEYGFEWETGKGKEEQIEKMFDLIDAYLDEHEDTDAVELYNDLTQEMLKNGFLKKQFQEELNAEKKKTSKAKIAKEEN